MFPPLIKKQNNTNIFLCLSKGAKVVWRTCYLRQGAKVGCDRAPGFCPVGEHTIDYCTKAQVFLVVDIGCTPRSKEARATPDDLLGVLRGCITNFW